MKCDNIRTRAQGDTPFFPNMLNNANVEVCLKEDVDKALAEKDFEIDRLKEFNAFLKQRISNGDVCRSIWLDDLEQKDKEIAKLKADYSAEVEELCIEKTNVDTLEQAWKRSQRVLWLVRAYFCGRSSEYFSGMASRCKIGQEDFYKEVSERAQRYLKASYKCQAKAKEYK